MRFLNIAFTQKEWKKQLTAQIDSEYLPYLNENMSDFDWEYECNAKAGSAKMEKCFDNFNGAADAISRLLRRTYYK